MGHGSCSIDGNCSCKWWSKFFQSIDFIIESLNVLPLTVSCSVSQGEGPDWQDFVGIVCLLILNSTISFIEENNAGNAAAALMAHLAPKAKVS